jgi:ribosome maturation factor RimP
MKKTPLTGEICPFQISPYISRAFGTGTNHCEEGSQAPLFIGYNLDMITKERVTSLILDKIAGSNLFIVEVNVRPGNVIDVTLDADTNVTIEDCTEVHRHLLREMDREVEDYSLEISSPDLTKPLKVLRQFTKNIGRTVTVKKQDKTKIEGLLLAADENGLVLKTAQKEEVPGKKGKKLVEREVLIPMGEVAETKILISFK